MFTRETVDGTAPRLYVAPEPPYPVPGLLPRSRLVTKMIRILLVALCCAAVRSPVDARVTRQIHRQCGGPLRYDVLDDALDEPARKAADYWNRELSSGLTPTPTFRRDADADVNVMRGALPRGVGGRATVTGLCPRAVIVVDGAIDGIMLQNVLRHEFGHVLGLRHRDGLMAHDAGHVSGRLLEASPQDLQTLWGAL